MLPSEVQLHMDQAFGEKAQSHRIPHFFIDVKDCNGYRVIVLNSKKGMIHGFTNKHNDTGLYIGMCYLRVTVPVGMYIRAYSRILDKSKLRCLKGVKMTACDSKACSLSFGQWKCYSDADYSRSPLLLMPGNRMFIKVQNSMSKKNNFWLYFESTLENLRKSFNVKYDSSTTGYITLHGFDQQLYYNVRLKVSYTLHLLQTHVIMLSFPYFYLNSNKFKRETSLTSFLELFEYTSEGSWKKLCRKHRAVYIKPNIYKTSVRFKFVSQNSPSHGFKSLFSFHPVEEEPHKLSTGLFNCTRHYESFHQHLDCNLRVECQNQEDEAEQCPFSSPLCNTSLYVGVNEHARFRIDLAFFLLYTTHFQSTFRMKSKKKRYEAEK